MDLTSFVSPYMTSSYPVPRLQQLIKEHGVRYSSDDSRITLATLLELHVPSTPVPAIPESDLSREELLALLRDSARRKINYPLVDISRVPMSAYISMSTKTLAVSAN